MQRDTSIRCTTSTCALPLINSERLDRDWYEGIVQKLKWNVPIRADTSEGPPPRAPSKRLTDKKIAEQAKGNGAVAGNGAAVKTDTLS